MRFGIFSLGCKVNQYEGDEISSILIKNGYQVAIDNLDIAIINTCSVTAVAAKKSRQKLRHIRNNNPNCIIIVTGCDVYFNQYQKLINEVNIILSNANKKRIIEAIELYKTTNRQVVFLDELVLEDDTTIKTTTDKVRAYIKIQDGCNYYCSYCIIPYIRNKLISYKPDNIINEINALVLLGYKEIILTGINIGLYQIDGINIVSLLKLILEKTQILRIRISSIEVNHITDELLILMRENPRILPHLHIPLQAGSDKVLVAMNRRYTISQYLDKIYKIRGYIQDINITTDLIVGFPTEEEEDFINSLNLISTIKYGKVHVFPYSKRASTAATKYVKQLTNECKKERVNKVLEFTKPITEEKEKYYMKQRNEVLIEELVSDSLYRGYSQYYFPILVKSDINIINEIIYFEKDENPLLGQFHILKA